MPRSHVLILNDGYIQSIELHSRLANLGFDVILLTAGSKQSVSESGSRNADIVLFDFLHDVESSDELIAARVANVLNIPLIFVSGKSKTEPQPPKEELPVPGFLLNPFDDLELQAAIELAIDTKRYELESSDKNERTLDLENFLTRQKVCAADDNKGQKKGEKEALELFRLLPEFAQLPEQGLIELSKRAQFSKMEPGQYIGFEGDQDQASFIVISGRIALSKTAPSGKELIVNLLGPGDFLGLLFAIEERPAQVTARAQTQSEVLLIKTSVLLRMLEEHPQLYKRFFEQVTSYLHSSHTISYGLAHDSVQVRIASLLLSLMVKFARVSKDLLSPVVIDITRQQIADLTGTTAETATRVTRAMHKQGIIDCGLPGILRIVDVDALKGLAGEK